MTEPLHPDVVVNTCHNCLPRADALPRQWRQAGHLVVVRELPCSGKIDLLYLLHAIEEVSCGLCVVTCPEGHCRLGQGNRRARVRVETLSRLLSEMGLDPRRAELMYWAPRDAAGGLERQVRAAVQRIVALGPCWAPRAKLPATENLRLHPRESVAGGPP